MATPEKTKIQKIKIDASGQIIGRLAANLAVLLRGKDKAAFTFYLAPLQKIIVFNTNNLRVAGQRIETKIYRRHSGYPGGLREEPLEKILSRDSRQVLRRAVYGMLPKNRLRDKIIKNLVLFKGKPVNL